MPGRPPPERVFRPSGSTLEKPNMLRWLKIYLTLLPALSGSFLPPVRLESGNGGTLGPQHLACLCLRPPSLASPASTDTCPCVGGLGPWDNPQGLFILAVPANLRFSEVEALGLESSEVGMWLMGYAGVAGEWC